MKFSEKYPNLKPLLEEAPNFIIRGFESQPCAICGEETEYVNLDYECPVCSEECMDIMDMNFFNAFFHESP